MTEKDLRKNNMTLKNVENFSYQINNEENDGINISELIFNLWDKKWIILFITVIFVIGAYYFYSKQPKIFKADVIILSPIKSNKIFQKYSANYLKLESSFIFEKFKQNLESRNMQKKFVLENNLSKVLDPLSVSKEIEILQTFSSMVKVKHKKDISTISILMNDPVSAANTINKFVRFINFETVKNEIDFSKKKINIRIRDIEHLIKTKRNIEKDRRKDQISRFREAQKIAIHLGFEKRVEATNIIQSTTKSESDFSTPLYYIGTKALEAEISVLIERKSDDPFIVGLRDLQEELALLKNYNFQNVEEFALKIDQFAFPPKTSFSRSRESTILIGLFSGLFSGIVLAILISYFQNLQKNFLERKRMEN